MAYGGEHAAKLANVMEVFHKMAEEMKTQNRKYFLDILRVIATGAVIMLHTITGIKDTTDMNLYPMEFRVFLAIMDLITWSVPVFIMISGYLFLNPAREFTFRLMLVKYCRRIVFALFLFGVPYACIELVLTGHKLNIGMLGEAVLMVLTGKSWSHMWYLYLIFFLYLFTPGIRGILKRLPVVWLYMIMAILVIGSSVFLYINKYMDADVVPVLPDTCIYVFYYLCGYLTVKKSQERSAIGEKKKAGFHAWLFPCMIMALAVGMVVNRMITNQQVQMAYDYPFTVAMAVLIFVWVANRQWELSEQNVKRWNWLSGLCFTIYLIHPVYVNIAYKFLDLTLLDYPLGISIPLFWVIISLLSLASAWVLSKIPVLKRYVL